MTEGVVYLKLPLSIKKSLKYLAQINQNLVNFFLKDHGKAKCF